MNMPINTVNIDLPLLPTPILPPHIRNQKSMYQPNDGDDDDGHDNVIGGRDGRVIKPNPNYLPLGVLTSEKCIVRTRNKQEWIIRLTI